MKQANQRPPFKAGKIIRPRMHAFKTMDQIPANESFKKGSHTHTKNASQRKSAKLPSGQRHTDDNCKRISVSLSPFLYGRTGYRRSRSYVIACSFRCLLLHWYLLHIKALNNFLLFISTSYCHLSQRTIECLPFQRYRATFQIFYTFFFVFVWRKTADTDFGRTQPQLI